MVTSKYQILILGAGLVSGPIVELLLGDSEYAVTLADINVKNAEKILNNHPRGKAVHLDIGSTEALQNLVEGSDVVVSLVPYALHTIVAKACIAAKVPMVNASYVSTDMQKLDEAAQQAGIIILCEIGLDPGIDHMTAMRLVHKIQHAGGKVTAFNSYCGGLPAPEANDNPFGYKFSWSPKGVLLAGKNDAHFLKNGERVDVAGADLFQHHWDVTLPDGTVFEGYPNRDSLAYIATYGLEGVRTMFRGTLRNANWCDTMDIIKKMGFLGDNILALGNEFSMRYLSATLMGLPEENLEEKVAESFDISIAGQIMETLNWLGLFDPKTREWNHPTAIDCLTEVMLSKMSYQPGERDMVILHHEFEAEFAFGKKKFLSTLIDYGIPNGYSAMSRTVTLPVGIAVKLIATGKIKLTGVRIPVEPEIYEPVLTELEKLGVSFEEREIPIN